MKFLLLTLSINNKKTLININNIVFTAAEQTDGVSYTRIFLSDAQMPENDIPCVDVKETAEEIYKKIKQKA